MWKWEVKVNPSPITFKTGRGESVLLCNSFQGISENVKVEVKWLLFLSRVEPCNTYSSPIKEYVIAMYTCLEKWKRMKGNEIFENPISFEFQFIPPLFFQSESRKWKGNLKVGHECVSSPGPALYLCVPKVNNNHNLLLPPSLE